MSRPISLEKAKQQYPHRYTLEHLPAWARKPHHDQSTNEFVGYYKPQYKTDLEWYENTAFPGENGIGKRETYCQSNNMSWPLGQGFSDVPCVKGQI